MQITVASHTFQYQVDGNTVSFLREADQTRRGAPKRNFLRSVAEQIIVTVRNKGHKGVTTAKGEGVSVTLPLAEDARPRPTRGNLTVRRPMLVTTVNHARAVLSQTARSQFASRRAAVAA